MTVDAGYKGVSAVFWVDAEPGRLDRDVAEIGDMFPALVFSAPGYDPVSGAACHGSWSGTLPVWPFDRPEPPGLRALIGDDGLQCALIYSAAHPMVPPHIYPIQPMPEIDERSQHRWHVAPDAYLCLMQTDGDWHPEGSITDLLLKAAAWRVEYALMKAGVVENMTLNGIVFDPSRDSHVLGALGDNQLAPTQTGGDDAA